MENIVIIFGLNTFSQNHTKNAATVPKNSQGKKKQKQKQKHKNTAIGSKQRQQKWNKSLYRLRPFIFTQKKSQRADNDQ